MIFDTLSQWRQYAPLSPRFAPAFEFLEKVTPASAVGRHEIAGDDIFAFVQKHQTKPYEERLYEAHRKYIDIQYMIRGREIVYWSPLAWLTEVTMPFDAEKDATLWKVIPNGVPFQLNAGHFTILYPEDGHVPSCSWGEAAEVLKVVVKVRV
jgi:biofilm protein TabA